MASAGEQFAMPDGSVYIVRRPAAETGGESVEMEFVLPSGCVPPPPHIHRHQVEEYEVLDGHLDVVVDGRWTTVAPGQSISVPVGALHTFRNRSGETVRVRNWHRPAMRFEDYIERTSRTLRAAGVTSKRDPAPAPPCLQGDAGLRRDAHPGPRPGAHSDAHSRPHRPAVAGPGALSAPPLLPVLREERRHGRLRRRGRSG